MSHWWDLDFADDDDRREFLSNCRSLEDVFGLVTTDEDWLSLAHLDATVRDLAAHIAQRAPFRAIRPVQILGHSCEKAGIFEQLRSASIEVAGPGARIAPSTTLGSVMNDRQLGRFVRRLQLFFPGIDSARGLWRRRCLRWVTRACLMVAVLAAIVSMLVKTPDDFPLHDLLVSVGMAATGVGVWGLLFLTLALPLLACGRWALRLNSGRFRSTIRTYRDLVDALYPLKQNTFLT